MDIEAKILHYLEERYAFSRKGILLNSHTQMLEQKIIDSLGMLELIAFVEENFCIEVPDEDIAPANFGTVQKLAGYLESRIRAFEGND